MWFRNLNNEILFWGCICLVIEVICCKLLDVLVVILVLLKIICLVVLLLRVLIIWVKICCFEIKVGFFLGIN